MAYFQILEGLRGCYMPDSSFIVQCDTRRDLRNTLEDISVNHHESQFGLNKKAIAWAAAKAWRGRRTTSQLAILPYGDKPKSRPFSIEIHGATRAQYLESRNA